jgi:DNA-binding IclR family transcriptional regulator
VTGVRDRRRHEVPTDAEQAILTLLQESELSLTPSNIAYNTAYSGGYVRKLCNSMAKAGYLEKDDTRGNPFYSITENGLAYLESEFKGYEN